MHLLSLNLQRPGAISSAVYGNFSAPKAQEVVAVKGNALELLRPDDTGKMVSICYTPVFSVVRSLLPFRLSGANRDYLVVGSDSGKISILEFDAAAGDWKSVHCEVFGKTGCRRIVPGQYLAVDPKGRAVMIASIEKQKFVYVMNRDAANKLTISSPLEAHKNDALLYSVVGLDVGFENPVFAMIELEYTDADLDPSGEAAREAEKKLTYYELDLGLNHVVRKWSEPISRTANLLLAVPGGDEGPSGVIICGENWISYKNQGHVELRVPLPRRQDLPSTRGPLITTGTVHKQKGFFFFMVQSEFGDLYKVTLERDASDPKIVRNVIATCFDTIQPANSLCITRTGLLFAASEFGNHGLFQFQGLGDDPSAVRSEATFDEELGDDSESASRIAPRFQPSPRLQNLLLTDDVPSLAPTTDLLIDNLSGEGPPQIHTLCGRGARSTLRILRHGVAVTEIAMSDLPGKPTGVWTVRSSYEGEFDRLIVVSFSNATIVLSIGETVEEVHDSGFLATAPTLQVALLADNSLLQVHSNGIRHIRPDQRTSEWKTPNKRLIQLASVNDRQVAIALAQGETQGEIICFELDEAGQLAESGTVDMGQEVLSMDLGVLPIGRARSPFLAIGLLDNTVQLLSLDQSDMLSQRSFMTVPARPESLCLVQMMREVTDTGKGSSSKSSLGGDASAAPTFYLNVGLATGVLVRVNVDAVTGSLSDSRQRFLGPKSVRLFRLKLRGQTGVLALTTRAWIMYSYQGRYFQSPISYDTILEHASNFASETCPEGIVAVAGNSLRIVTVDTLGTMFNQIAFPLRYTPRKMFRMPHTSMLVIIETDQHEFNEEERAQLAASSSSGSSSSSSSSSIPNGEGAVGDEEEEEEGTFVIPARGPMPPMDGKWASCIRVFEPSSGESKEVLELSNNEAAFSTCACRFSQHSEETFVIVGTAKGLTLHPRQASACYLHVYRILDGRLQLLHQTEVEDVPMCMSEFQGRLVVGIGRTLRMYDLGKKKLLRKCENRTFPNAIVRLQCNGDRLYVGDLIESVHFVKYKRQENVLNIFADEEVPRYVTALCPLDYNTVGGGDKFGNIFVLRLPDSCDDDVDEAGGVRALWDIGSRTKASLQAHYYLGEIITSLAKCALMPGGPDVMIASTITGGLYAFLPFTSKEDVSFFQHLEMFLRQEHPNACQRDHMSYRSFYQPVKDIIDGDLCERYSSMPSQKQKEMAEDVGRTTAEVVKKLEEIRNFL